MQIETEIFRVAVDRDTELLEFAFLANHKR
jgi:hypothetical protein